MNKFDERYDIRLANFSDIDDIMKFIDLYWAKGHIMSLDRDLFIYEYADGDNINIIIAIDKVTNLIEGIFGFIKCSNTDDPSKKDIWGSMWKVNDTHDNIPLLGIELAKRVFEITGCRTQIGNGANPKTTIPLRRIFFGEKVVKMKQYYLLNNNMSNYKIAVINQKRENIILKNNNVILNKFESIKDITDNFKIENDNVIPYKDTWYVNKRYFNHPYYQYDVYGLENIDKKETEAILIARELEIEGSKVLRIVDYIGNQRIFAGLYDSLNKLILQNNYEYIDFFTFGFDEESILNAGFVERIDNDVNIIPNFFEPFLQKNIDIWAHYKYDNTMFFKADGDQDRPNIFKINNKGEIL